MDFLTICIAFLNWALIIVIAFIIYRIIKREAKRWIKEALNEYEKGIQHDRMMRNIDHVRNKYQL